MCPEYNATIMINFFKSLFLGETEQTDESIPADSDAETQPEAGETEPAEDGQETVPEDAENAGSETGETPDAEPTGEMQPGGGY